MESLNQNIIKQVWDILPEGLLLSDENGTVLYTNLEFCKTYGHSPKDITGANFAIILPIELRGKATQLYQRVFQEQIEPDEYLRVIRKGAGEKCIVDSKVEFIYEQGKKIAMLTINKDILERKKMEENLRVHQEELSQIVNSNSIATFVIDREHKITHWNKACEVLTGWHASKVLGTKNQWMAFYDENRPLLVDLILNGNVKAEIEKYYSGRYQLSEIREEAFEAEDFFPRIGENGKWLFFTAAPLKDLNGEIIGAIETLQDISKQKWAEKELEESEKRYRKAQEIGKVGHWGYNLKTAEFWGSDEAKRIYGFEPSDQNFTSEKVESCIPDRQRVHQALVDLIEKNQEYNLEFDIVSYNKKERKTILSQAILETDINENPFQVSGVIQDITERKKVEKIIEESEKKYRLIFENINDTYYETSFEGIILELSPSVNKLARGQYKRADLIGKSIYNLYENPAKRMELLNELKKEGHVSDFEINLLNKDGSIFNCSVSAKIQMDDKNTPLKIIGTIRDITQRKRAEIAVINNERDLKLRNQIVESFLIVDYYKMFNTVLNILLKQFESRFGIFGFINEIGELVCPTMTYDIWEKCEVKDKDFIFPKSSWAGVWGQSLNEKRNIIKNENLKVPGGHIQLNNAMVAVVLNKDKLIGMIALANKENGYNEEDLKVITEVSKYISPLLQSCINERKQKEELVMAKEKAEESDRLKSAFLANMSHEIRTPMNGILGFTSLLQDPDLSGEEQQQYIEIIKQSGDRMLSTVNDLIDISRIETGQVESVIKELNIIEEIKSLYEFFKAEANRKGLQLVLENLISENRLMVKTDQQKFNSILTNIIKNALKFTDKGRIEIGCKIKDEFIQFYVKDTGIGIPPKRQQAIFDRFVQADIGDSRAFEGSGLGLSITKAYIEMLGGKIWLKSKEGEGSTFYFTLPGLIDKYTETKSQKEIPVSIQTKSDKKLKILIAEDDETSRLHLSFALNNLAKELLFATTGTEALRICKENPDLDLILMDVKMPGMDGYQATQKIRKFNKDIVIIAQTAYALSGDRQKAIESGCNDYITKPIKKTELIKIIRNNI